MKKNILSYSTCYKILVLLGLIFIGQPQSVWSQTVDELTRLKEEKEKAVLRKEIAEAEAAELKAKFPDAKTTPLEGKTTIDDGVIIETQIMAYKAMKEVAQEVSTKIGSVDTLAIYDPKEQADILNFRANKERLKLITDQYCKTFKKGSVEVCPDPTVISASAAPALPIISSLLGQFVDLTSFLRTNVEITGKSFAIDEPAVASEIFLNLKARNPNASLYYPAMFPPRVDGSTTSDFLTALNKAINTKSAVESLLLNLEIAEKNVNEAKAGVGKINVALAEVRSKRQETLVYLARLQRIYNKKVPAEKQEVIEELRDRLIKLEREEAELTAKLSEAQANLTTQNNAQKVAQANFENQLQNRTFAEQAAAQSKIINQQLEQYILSLIQVDKTTGTNALTMYIKAEQLETLMARAQNNGRWLQVKVLQAGGNNRIKTNLIWDIFTGGNRLSHSGGVIVQYILFDQNGKAIGSGTVTKYTKYQKASKI